MEALAVKNLSVFYGTVHALDNVSFRVGKNEIVSMIGPNGAGKSTALNVVAGIVELVGKNSGEIFFNGEKINRLEPFKLVKKGLCLVPEGRRIFPTMTVLENLEMGAYILKNKDSVQGGIERVFSIFPDLEIWKKQKAGTLSSGSQQMLSMGRALMLKPKLLLIDEPSLGLSPNYVKEIFKALNDIRAGGTTILLVEQNVRVALENSDRTYVFEIGKIAIEGLSKELKENEKIKKLFLGG